MVIMVYKTQFRTDVEMRNDPRDQLERDFAENEAEIAAEKILERYRKEPHFLEAVLAQAIRKLMPDRDQAFAERKGRINK